MSRDLQAKGVGLHLRNSTPNQASRQNGIDRPTGELLQTSNSSIRCTGSLTGGGHFSAHFQHLGPVVVFIFYRFSFRHFQLGELLPQRLQLRLSLLEKLGTVVVLAAEGDGARAMLKRRN